jgi:aldehyde dehydrogenase (NAD+)
MNSKRRLCNSRNNLKEALKLDMGRPGMEADLVEIMPVISEINFVIKHLKSWTKDKSVSTPALYTGTKSWVRHEAKGNCLLIGPWNYPFHLIFYPLVSAIAAGNTAMMKPSEFTPNVSKVIHQVVKNVFDANEVFVIDGGIDVSDMLLNLPFDHIFFTGSTRVGQIVMEKAAKHLASVTLELGGKSPVVIDKNVDIEEAAHKVAWGKFINAGQTCIAPDYVWVHEDIATAFIDAFKKTLEKFLTDENEGFTSIINEAHFKRLAGWLEEAKQAGGKIEVGGHCDEATNKIEMTLISEPGECTLMNEEIFGPILPLKTYSTTKEVIEGIQAQGYPLALYIFSKITIG